MGKRSRRRGDRGGIGHDRSIARARGGRRPRQVLRRAADEDDHPRRSRRFLRHLRPSARPPHDPPHPRQPDHGAGQHAGGIGHQGRQLRRRGRAQGRLDPHQRQSRLSDVSGVGPARRGQDRHARLQLARHLQRHQPGHGAVAHLAGQDARRRHENRSAGRRRHAGIDRRATAARLQHHSRHQVQGHHRLWRDRRGPSRDRAR